ncbi:MULTISPECIES: hypothetical protein [Okeania]|uniref:hypothetical protein n=1 Tax=Okeania TaxID=1458928 RepID=UPI000F52E91D|nr:MULTISPECIES: hypothetical protein [Okeania]NET12321.1 hypothetical protein [Okeania sp. SIO1H6]NES78367.1 hypothetical protein [Okeania sp. SIO1H4]NET21706.1 hypothetical protein [Okeania sp. SIO1H5]NET79030.1 hypothetical protein [Okeania sp. SIO1F9]NET95055.1 hypothetical protein [Okeania sp. SIO1H2]
MLKFIRPKLLFTIFISLLIFLYIPNLKRQKVSAQFISSPEVNALDDSLNNVSISSFVQSVFNYSQQLYGEPRIAVKKVNLRLHTTPLASLDNANQGEFTIYLSRKPSEYAFHGQLSHEIFHLLNAQLLDCYVEGLATVFAEKVLTRKDLDWSGWETYFQQGSEPFYSLTYSMMKEVSETAGSANMSRLLEFAVDNKASKKWMHIDIDGWLSLMSNYVKIEVEKVINKYIVQVKPVVGSKNNMYTCLAPTKN